MSFYISTNILSFRIFNEGWYLHSRVTVQIFNSEAPLILFNIIGWGKLIIHLIER